MRKCAVVSLLFVLAACGDSSTEPEPIWGTYTLQTMAEQPLPYVIYQVGADKFEITAGDMRLDSDMTFSNTNTLRTTEIGVVTTRTITYSGTFTVNDSFLTFTCSCYGSPFFGSLGGKTVTIIRDWFGEGIMWVFGKP